MYARVADDLPRQAAAMRAAPEMVRGAGELDTELMRHLPGAVVKGGAEALACVGLPDEGLGVAVRVEDGGYRALDPALIDTLRQSLGWADVPDGLAAFAEPDLLDSNLRAVGTLRSNVRLTTR
jgi:L-asparaginase II